MGLTIRKGSTRSAPGRRYQVALKSLAAMFSQERDNSVHLFVLSATDHRTAIFFLSNQACADKPAQMKGERGSRHVETGLDIGDAKAGWPGTNQQPINVQACQIA